MKTITDSNGLPIENGCYYIFKENSSALALFYADKDMKIVHMNPIVANSNGELPDIFFKPGIYHVKVYDKKNKLIYPKWPFTFRDASFEVK